MHAAEVGINQLSADEDVLNFLRTGENASTVYSRLYQLRNQQDFNAYFRLFSNDGKFEAKHRHPSFQGIGDSFLKYRLGVHEGVIDHLSPLDDGAIYSLSKTIREDGEILGYLTFNFSVNDINDFLQTKGSNYVLVNRNNRVILSDNSFFRTMTRLNNEPLLDSRISRIGNRYFMLNERPLGFSGLTIYGVSSFDVIGSLIVIELVAFIVMLAFMVYFLRRISSSAAKTSLKTFDELFISLKHYRENNKLLYLEVENEDMKPFVQQYNNLLTVVEDLLVKNIELEKQSNIAEIKQLQSQFNPHFMFNILDTIKYMISIDPDKAYSMIIKLSRLLRYSLDYSDNSMAILAQDLVYIKDYLKLQRVRLGKQFTYEIIAPDKELYKVPKLVIQPMVENSINHGYVQGQEFKLRIEIKAVNDQLIIIIEDNGAGIPKGQLKQIRSNLKTLKEDYRHVGIMNSHKRIRLLFGEPYGIKISSEENVGTKIVMTLKAVRV